MIIAIICLCLAIAALASRLYRLDEIPPGLLFDEGAHGVDALQVISGKHTIFFADNSGREALIVYAVALAHTLLGTSILAIRLPAALASAGAVLTLFYAGFVFFCIEERTKTFRPWRGVFIGGVGATLFAVSLNHLVIGRLAFRANLFILLLPLCLGLLWQGWHQDSKFKIILSGLCAGILQYTYTPARLHPLLLLLFGLTLLISPAGNTLRRSREAWQKSVPFVLAFALVVSPLLIYFVSDTDHAIARISHLSILSLESPLSMLLRNTWDHMLVYGFRGDPKWAHTYAGLPMLNPWETLFFWVGIALALWRWRTHITTRFLTIWIGVMLVPAVLAYDVPRNTLRMIGAAPAVYLLIGFAVWECFQLVKKRTPFLALALVILLASITATQGWLSYRTYFQKYASWAITQKDFHGQWSYAALELNSIPPIEDAIYVLLSENSHAHYGFDYLYEGEMPAYVVNHRGPGMPYESKTSRQTLFVLARDDPSTIVMLDWDEQLGWNDSEEEELFNLLRRHGQYMGSEKRLNFQLHTFEDMSLQLPWRFYEQLEPRTINYDAGINLLGFAVGQGEKWGDSRSVTGIDKHETVWIGMRWQIESNRIDSEAPSSTDADYKVSLRLRDAAGNYPYHKDRLLKHFNTDMTTTPEWPFGQPVDTLFFLDIPSNLPSGLYELRLIVYNAETLIPTVEIGTWEAEANLTKLLVRDKEAP